MEGCNHLLEGPQTATPKCFLWNYLPKPIYLRDGRTFQLLLHWIHKAHRQEIAAGPSRVRYCHGLTLPFEDVAEQVSASAAPRFWVLYPSAMHDPPKPGENGLTDSFIGWLHRNLSEGRGYSIGMSSLYRFFPADDPKDCLVLLGSHETRRTNMRPRPRSRGSPRTPWTQTQPHRQHGREHVEKGLTFQDKMPGLANKNFCWASFTKDFR